MPIYRLGTGIGARVAVAAAIVSAIGAAVAIVTLESRPADAASVTAAEVVHLEPVVVTISRDRFDELYAEAHPASRAVASAR